MWSVMMVGMMLPSAAPTILLFAARGAETRRATDRSAAPRFFVAGYFLVWSILLARRRGGADAALARRGLMSTQMAMTSAVARRRRVHPRRALRVHAAEEPLPHPLPLAARLDSPATCAPGDSARCAWASQHGALLRRLLLGADAAALRRRRDEPPWVAAIAAIVLVQKLLPRRNRGSRGLPERRSSPVGSC